MMSNRYDVQHLSSSFAMFPDGAIVSKTIVHPQQRGRELQLYGLGSTIWKESINVISQSSSVTAHLTAIYTSPRRQQTAHHHDDYDCNIRVMLKPIEGNRQDSSPSSGMISLKLQYSTPTAFWKPQYFLDIRKDSDAILTLQAGICRPQPGAWGDHIVSVSNHSIHHLQDSHLSSSGNACQKEHALGQSHSRFASYTWQLSSSFASDPTIGTVLITECFVDVQAESGVLSSRLRARLDTNKARSLPTGDMQIMLRGNPIKSVHMPLWNPEQVLDVEVDQDPAIAQVKLPSKPLFDPYRIECLLNPIVSEGHQTDYIARITIKAEDEVEALVHASKHKPISNGAPPLQLPHADLNSTSISKGNGRPVLPNSTTSNTVADTAEAYRELWPNGNPVQRSPSEGESFWEQSRHNGLVQRTDDSNWHPAAEEQKSRIPEEAHGHGYVPLNGGQASLPRPLKPSPVLVDLRICKAWKDSTALRWISSRGHWETFAGGTVSLIEVHLAGNPEPIHLKGWRGGEWKGRFCDGSSLSMTFDEVVRLTDMGGWGQGTLRH